MHCSVQYSLGVGCPDTQRVVTSQPVKTKLTMLHLFSIILLRTSLTRTRNLWQRRRKIFEPSGHCFKFSLDTWCNWLYCPQYAKKSPWRVVWGLDNFSWFSSFTTSSPPNQPTDMKTYWMIWPNGQFVENISCFSFLVIGGWVLTNSNFFRYNFSALVLTFHSGWSKCQLFEDIYFPISRKP